jgi:signal transduction histidine kinase
MQFFVFNGVCACLIMNASNLLGNLLDIVWLRRVGPFAFIAMHGLMVWAICAHRFFDARQVMSSIAQRVALLCVLTASLVSFSALLDGRVESPFDVLLAALSAGLVTVVLERPARKWFGLDHEHLLARPRQVIINHARSEADTEGLKQRFQNVLREWCQTSRADLLLARGDEFSGSHVSVPADWLGMSQLCPDGWITPELMQRKRPDSSTGPCAHWLAQKECGALLAVPRGSDRPDLLVFLGQRESLRPYTYPDIQLLFSLTELMDNILTHASLAQHSAKMKQLEAATMMSRSLAHDLNNLTTPIAAYLLCSEGRTKPGSPEAEVYDAARHSVKVMGNYIQESLFFSRRLTPEFKQMNPRDALASITKLSQERASHQGVTLAFHCEEGLRFSADPALFERLALNLVNNAIDASARGGHVMISAGRKSGSVCLRVEDQGVGIRPENMRRVFDPYFTTKDTGDTRRGLGLGLAICRKIMDLHGGEIAVHSVLGQGTVFTVSFPGEAVEKSSRSHGISAAPRLPLPVDPGFIPASIDGAQVPP